MMALCKTKGELIDRRCNTFVIVSDSMIIMTAIKLNETQGGMAYVFR